MFDHDPFAATLIWGATEAGPALPWPELPMPPVDTSEQRYEVGEVLGKGGMSVVFAAVDRETGQEVAIKVARRDLPVRGEQLLLNELAVLAHLRTASTLPVLGSGSSAGGRPFFVMPRVSGGTLGDLIAATREAHPHLQRSLIRRRLLSVFDRLCAAVEDAHDQGIVHRDIKPGNVLVAGYDDAFLIDWGLSGPEGVGYFEGEIPEGRQTSGGTPGYLAPESLRGAANTTDRRADVWSLGAVLYEILTLERAIARSSLSTMLAMNVKSAPIPPIQLCPDLVGGQSLSDVTLQALAREPAHRFQSVGRLRKAVRDGLAWETARSRWRQEHG